MNAVVYGAGNIGRGFVGALLSRSGYEVTFIDIDNEVVSLLNGARGYPVKAVSDEGASEEWISPVAAIHGSMEGEVASAIASADIIATAVGVRALPFAAPLIALGLELRYRSGAKPVNIIVCENMLNASAALRSMLAANMGGEAASRMDSFVGIAEASVGRMVPVQTDAMRGGDRLRVCVEPYRTLPVDRDALIGDIPDIEGLVAVSPFDFYVRRKLFLHNMGHAVCAYLGMYAGVGYIHDAIRVPEIRLIASEAMLECSIALSAAYGADIRDLASHRSDLIRRFGNSALMDTCGRVGADIPRKLSRDDRLIGASAFCEANGVAPAFILAGCAAALREHIALGAGETQNGGAEATLAELSGLANRDISDDIIEIYRAFSGGSPLRDIITRCDTIKRRRSGGSN